MSRSLLVTIGSFALLAAIGAAACERTSKASPHAQNPVSAQAAAAAQTGPPPKTLTLGYDRSSKPKVGTEILATAEGLPPGARVDVLWGTVQGGWIIENGYRFKGKNYTETTTPLGRADVGTDGRLTYRFTIPEDYGGVHDVMVSGNGVTLAQGGVEVSQTFEMSPGEGPIGTLVELRVKGFGWRTMESTWVVNWDNQAVGWVSAADTRGTAVARFRATGPVGTHTIKVYTGYMGQGYLNHEQAPNAYLDRPEFVFRVTPGSAVPSSAYAEPYPKQAVPSPEGTGRATLNISPTQGPVLSRAVLQASGLPAGVDVALVWSSQAGSRVTASGFAPKETELLKRTVSADGRLEIPLTIPDDLGGLHTLSIRSHGKVLATTSFVVETSIVGISPTSGPVGTPVTIHLKGVGWTDYDNIYIATYDNAYMGYACGFNSQGDVVINFAAAGTPGTHLIDLYPGIYQGPEGGQQLYRLPQLTYADDHPGNKIPALRFAFEVTPSPVTARPSILPATSTK